MLMWDKLTQFLAPPSQVLRTPFLSFILSTRTSWCTNAKWLSSFLHAISHHTPKFLLASNKKEHVLKLDLHPILYNLVNFCSILVSYWNYLGLLSFGNTYKSYTSPLNRTQSNKTMVFNEPPQNSPTISSQSPCPHCDSNKSLNILQWRTSVLIL